MLFMKKVGMAWLGLLRAAALGIAMLLAPAVASAHGAADRQPIAGESAAAGQDAMSPPESDCLYAGVAPASGHHLHCCLSSLPSMAVGANQSTDHDQAVAPAPALRAVVLHKGITYSMPAAHVPIAALPSFILFGNFRS